MDGHSNTDEEEFDGHCHHYGVVNAGYTIQCIQITTFNGTHI